MFGGGSTYKFSIMGDPPRECHDGVYCTSRSVFTITEKGFGFGPNVCFTPKAVTNDLSIIKFTDPTMSEEDGENISFWVKKIDEEVK